MQPERRFFLAVTGLGLTLTGLAAAAQPKVDLRSLQGEWAIYQEGHRENHERIFGARLRIVGDRASIIDHDGRATSLPMPARVDGRMLVLDSPSAGTAKPISLGLTDRGLLAGSLPSLGAVTLTRIMPGRENTEPQLELARAPVPKVQGRYMGENAPPGTGMMFSGRLVEFLRDGQAQVKLPYEQQGNQIVIFGPHMEQKLDILADGRLRLAIANARTVYYRKAP